MKNVSAFPLLSAVFIALFCSAGQAQNNTQPEYAVKKLWTSEKVFETPESVIYDKQRNIIFVSNIFGSPHEKDGKGFISKLSIDGKVEKLKWIEGLDAPKGMGIFNGRLYVTDLDQAAEISIEQGKILQKYKSDKALFLNDISIDNSGSVFVSDNRAGIVFQLKDGRLEPWLKSPALSLPNGLLAETDRLLIGNDGYLLSADYKTKKTSRLIEDTDFIDGLVSFGGGQYLVSDFLGAVHIIHPSKKKIKILDTTSKEIMAADIDFIEDKRILLVPAFFDNRIYAYQITQK